MGCFEMVVGIEASVVIVGMPTRNDVSTTQRHKKNCGGVERFIAFHVVLTCLAGAVAEPDFFPIERLTNRPNSLSIPNIAPRLLDPRPRICPGFALGKSLGPWSPMLS